MKLRRAGLALVMGCVVLAGGCKKFRKTRSQAKSADYADKLKPIVAAHKVQVLHVPDFGDYSALVQTFYEDRNYEVAWVDDGKPSPQGQAFITAFQHAQEKGLNPEDFDASKWDGLTGKLAGKNDDDVAQFDAAMTVCVMRYISDLRLGRVNPTHFNFDINTQDKKYNLPEFVSDNAVDAADVPKLIASVEPDNDDYRRTEAALGKYLVLAKQQGAAVPLPDTNKVGVAAGGSYVAADALRARLQLEGDLAGGSAVATAPVEVKTAPASKPVGAKAKLSAAIASGKDKIEGKRKTPAAAAAAPAPAAAPVAASSTAYTSELADAVKHYQARHGITDDGKLNSQTVASLNVPLSARVNQMADALERWRWLPNDYVNAPLMVNLPEFVVRGYDSATVGHKLDFTMKVVDGKVVGEHQTPVFVNKMKYVIFRPFWNVPISIVKKELASHIEKSGVGYLASKNFETVDSKGQIVNASAAEVERGGVMVREKPGPKNSLGLIKFMFPNEYDIYLHSTPAPELFNRTRRDFSHGCVRVQYPDQLAVWVLRNTPGDWTLDKVHAAFNDEAQNNHQVNLAQQIPIVIFYVTANVAEDGTVRFFDDIYGYDKQLDDVLAKGMPYPAQQTKVNPNAVSTPGDTD